MILQNLSVEKTVCFSLVGLLSNPKNVLKITGNDYLAGLLTFGENRAGTSGWPSWIFSN